MVQSITLLLSIHWTSVRPLTHAPPKTKMDLLLHTDAVPLLQERAEQNTGAVIEEEADSRIPSELLDI